MNRPRIAGMNVDKMRRQQQRIADSTEDAQQRVEREGRALWLASLTPEHRAVHEGPWSFLCAECRQEASRQIGVSMARAFAAMTSRSTVGLGDTQHDQ